MVCGIYHIWAAACNQILLSDVFNRCSVAHFRRCAAGACEWSAFRICFFGASRRNAVYRTAAECEEAGLSTVCSCNTNPLERSSADRNNTDTFRWAVSGQGVCRASLGCGCCGYSNAADTCDCRNRHNRKAQREKTIRQFVVLCRYDALVSRLSILSAT